MKRLLTFTLLAAVFFFFRDIGQRLAVRAAGDCANEDDDGDQACGHTIKDYRSIRVRRLGRMSSPGSALLAGGRRLPG